MNESARMMERERIGTLKPKIHPSTKFYIVLFMSVSCFIVPNYIFGYSIFLLNLVIAFMNKKGKPYVSLLVKSIIPIVVIMIIFQGLFYPGNTILMDLGFLKFKEEGLLYSLNLTSKLIAISTSLLLFFQLTPMKEIVLALENSKLPVKATYVITATIQLIPEMKKSMVTIMDAQKSRGVETEGNLRTRFKAFIPILSPLVLGAISSNEEKVLTLESRGFSSKNKKTRLYNIEKNSRDRVIPMILIVLLIMLIAWRVMS